MKNTETSLQAIGIFDSGVGGLTVLKKLIHTLPQEHFIYFGDTARLPYGEKSRETIINYSNENTAFLLQKNIKLLVVACNTASSQALPNLTQTFSIPIVGTITPSVDLALEKSKNKRIAVIGTRGTISSKAYEKAILTKCPSAFVLSIACPLLVPLIEEQMADHLSTKLILNDYLKAVKEQNIDTLILGCTHYPLLTHLIQSTLGDFVQIIDCADALATTVKNTLQTQDIEGKHQNSACQFFVSDDPPKFERIGQKFLQMPFTAHKCTIKEELTRCARSTSSAG